MWIGVLEEFNQKIQYLIPVSIIATGYDDWKIFIRGFVLNKAVDAKRNSSELYLRQSTLYVIQKWFFLRSCTQCSYLCSFYKLNLTQKYE